MKFFIADAFSDTLFGGNPAGVVLLPSGTDFPSDETMIKTAAELRYSETAFIKQLSDNEFNVRYFTPVAEVDLCGHATIAAFYCLMSAGVISENCQCLNHTKAGDINIEVKDSFVMMEMAAPKFMHLMDNPLELDRIYEIMGTEYDASLELRPMIISTGLPDIMLPVNTKEELDALQPDMFLLSKVSEEYKVTGVHAFTLDSEDGVTAHCRNFAPLYDIDEEAATGTASGALTYYLYLNRCIGASDSCNLVQGEAMGRPSAILTEINADSKADGSVDCKIKVGGKAVVLASGEIML